MGFTYNVLQEKYKELKKKEKEITKELDNYKYLYEKEKEEVDNLKRKLNEKDIIIGMFHKMYYENQ